MKNGDKIIELLTEFLRGQDRIVAELKGTNRRLDLIIERLDRSLERFDKLEIAGLHDLVAKLERTVYK